MIFKKRLLWQLYPSFLLIIVISVVGVALYGFRSFRKFHLDQVARDLKSRAHLIEKQVSSYLANRDFEKINDLCKQAGLVSATRITIILPDGQVIADSDETTGQMKNHSDRPEFQSALKLGIGKSLRFSDTLGKKMMYLAIPLKQNNETLAVIRTSVPITAIDEALSNIYGRLFLAVIVIAIFAAIISLAISKKISRPVEQMTKVAKDFTAGDLNKRLSIPKAVELAELAGALNEMARRLSRRIETITKERSQIQAILSSMAEGVLAVGLNGDIVSINKTAAKLLNVDPEKSKGLNIEGVIRNIKLQQYLQDILEQGKSTSGNVLCINDGSHFLQLYGSVLTDNKGNSNGAVLVLNDVTRTYQLEKVRRDFVANVSHELKTPVTSIKGFVETLLDGTINDTEQARRFLEIIAKHADRLNAIIEDLLSLSRLEDSLEQRRLSFENVSIKSSIDSAIELSKLKAGQKGIKLELSCDKDIKAKINSVLIEQAVLNLIDNAIKYSQEQKEIHIDVHKKNSEINIAVSDHGCGIAQEHLERIFERFYVVDKGRSRKLGGTGLGLSIVKHIAQVHGGYVEAQSTVGKGTTFTIHLPQEDT